jgi:hypothetical protein
MEFVAYLWASGGFQAIADAHNREAEGMDERGERYSQLQLQD